MQLVVDLIEVFVRGGFSLVFIIMTCTFRKRIQGAHEEMDRLTTRILYRPVMYKLCHMSNQVLTLIIALNIHYC